jgi:hypothetical protein
MQDLLKVAEGLLGLAFLVAWFVAPALVNRRLALKRGRNEINWIILGVLFQWLSTLVLLSLSSPCASWDESIKTSQRSVKRDINGFK